MNSPILVADAVGVSVGGVLVALAVVLAWRHRVTRAEVLGLVGAVLLVFGLVAPSLLRVPSRYWWKFSLALGRVMAMFWMTLLFALVLTPVSLLWRVLGRDPLLRRRANWRGWSEYSARYRDPHHYDQMY